MEKLFKKILLLTFAIGALLLISSSTFAANYKVSIAVLGNQRVGKTQVIRGVLGKPFQDPSDPTNWRQGAYGMQTQISLGGDVFECNYYDAPGYLGHDDATLEEQIDGAAIHSANIAIIIVDPLQTYEGSEFAHAIDEAVKRHAAHVRKINSKCKVIVVVNKIDRLSKAQLDRWRKKQSFVRDYFDDFEIDCVFTSAKDGDGIDELKRMIYRLLGLNKASFPTFTDVFHNCVRCGKGEREDRCVQGSQGVWYCGEGCLRLEEGRPCNYSKCSTRETKRFLRCKHEGHVGEDGEMYCSPEHEKKAHSICAIQ